MKIKVKKMSPDAILPTSGTDMAAGYDLYACGIKNEDGVQIYPGQVEVIGTGIAVEIPEGYAGLLMSRSGMATKRGLRLSTGCSLLDPDFRGEIFCPTYNDSSKPRDIKNGDRIAQLVVVPFMSLDFELTDELSDTNRGTGGFGSTGR